MNLFIAKLFYKNKFVRIEVVSEDKRVSTFYVIPVGDTVTIPKQEISFTIDKENMLLKNGIPTYYFNYGNTNSLNLYDSNNDLVMYSPSQFNSALNNNLIKDIFNAFNTGEKISINVFMLGFIMVVILGLGYLGFKQFEILNDKIEELKNLIDFLTGFNG